MTLAEDRSPAERHNIPLFDRYKWDIQAHIKTVLAQPLVEPLARKMVAHQFGFDIKLDGNYQGKAARGSLALLTVDATGGDVATATPAAAALEIFHNATLIWDDYQDNDRLRRNRSAVWAEFGWKQAINAGAAALELNHLTIYELRRRGYSPDTVLKVGEMLTRTGLTVVNGQVMDMRMEQQAGASEDEYLEMVRSKTGALIEASVMVGLELGKASEKTKAALARYARAIGDSYQIADDLRGIWGSAEETGKRKYGDLARKKQSYPIVVAYEVGDYTTKRTLAEIFSESEEELDEKSISEVLLILDRLHVRQRVERKIDDLHQEAIEAIEEADISDWAKRDYILIANAISLKPAPQIDSAS